MTLAVRELQQDRRAIRRTSVGMFSLSSRCGLVRDVAASEKARVVAEDGTSVMFAAFAGEMEAVDRKRPSPSICAIMFSVSAKASECSNTDMPTSVMTDCCCSAHENVSTNCDKQSRRNVGHKRAKEPERGRTSPILLMPIAAQELESVENVSLDERTRRKVLSLTQSSGLYLSGDP